MPKRVENVLIEDIVRRSKFLLLKLSSQETLIIHLGMSGRLLAERDVDETITELGNFNFDTHKIHKHCLLYTSDAADE